MTKLRVLNVGCWSLFVIAIISTAGCGDAGPSTMVSGKVTTGGKPVSGTIHFVGSDGKEAQAPVGPTGGTYTVSNPPVGEVTVLVKPTPGAPVPAPAAPNAGGTPMTMEMPGGTNKTAAGEASVPPPAKYGDPATSGLKYTVTSGKQQKDFDLAP